MADAGAPSDGGSIWPAIDTSGDVPTLRLVAFLSTLMATVLLAWFKAIMSWIRGIGDGVSNTFNDLSTFLYALDGERSVIGIVLDGADRTMAAAWDSNAAFLTETFGTFAQVVAIVEIVAVLWLLYAGIRAGYRNIREGVA